MTTLQLLLAFIPAYLIRFQIGQIPTNLFEAAALMVFLGEIIAPATWRQWRAAVLTLPKVVIWCVAAFVMAALISTAVSAELRVSLGILKSWIIVPLIVAWLAYVASDTEKRREFLLAALRWTGVVVALIGLGQLDSLERIRSIYDVPNSLALWLAPVLVLTIWQIVAPTTSDRGRNSYQALIVQAGVMGAALVATQSVGGMVAVIVVLGASWWHVRQKSAWLLIAIILAASFLWHTGRLSYLAQPWMSGQSNSLSVRRQLWSVSLDLIKRQPVTGIGLGQFEPAYQAVLHERFARCENNCPLPEFVFRDPHNWLLSMWLNVGLVGLLSFAGLHAYLFYRAWCTWSELSVATKASIWALTTLLIFGLVDTIYWKNDLAVLHWVFMAVVARGLTTPHLERGAPPRLRVSQTVSVK